MFVCRVCECICVGVGCRNINSSDSSSHLECVRCEMLFAHFFARSKYSNKTSNRSSIYSFLAHHFYCPLMKALFCIQKAKRTVHWLACRRVVRLVPENGDKNQFLNVCLINGRTALEPLFFSLCPFHSFHFIWPNAIYFNHSQLYQIDWIWFLPQFPFHRTGRCIA